MKLNIWIIVIAMAIVSVILWVFRWTIFDRGLDDYRELEWSDNIIMTENLREFGSTDGKKLEVEFPGGDTSNVSIYGLLYDYENARKACPKKWHLPTTEEWDRIFGFEEGQFIKSITDPSLIPVIPAGYGNSGEFDDLFGTHMIIWSSTKVDSHLAWGYILTSGSDSIRKAPQHLHYAFSVRCIKDHQKQ